MPAHASLGCACYTGPAIEAVDDLLDRCFGVDLSKRRLDPLSERDFLRITRDIAKALVGGKVGRIERAELDRAIRALQLNYARMTDDQISAAFRRVNRQVRQISTKIDPDLDALLKIRADETVKGTRVSVRRRFRLRIPSKLNATDEAIARFIRASQKNFVRDEYGRRGNELSSNARDIVASGLDRGLDRESIGEELEEKLGAQFGARIANYWQIVANAFVNRARSFATLSSFQEGGIKQYRFSSVVDEATTDICRMLNDKRFDVGRGLKTFTDAEKAKSAESIRSVTPWVRRGVDDDGNEVMFYEKGGKRFQVARVVESGVGRKDRAGRFSQELSNKRLQNSGLTIPPVHGLCRSRLLAV